MSAESTSKTPARLTVVSRVYYQDPEGEITSVNSQFERSIRNNEQPLIRYMKVGTEWKPLESAWLTSGSTMILENLGSDTLTLGVLPSPQKEGEDLPDPIVVSQIPQKCSIQLMHPNLSQLVVCYNNTDGRCRLSIIPE